MSELKLRIRIRQTHLEGCINRSREMRERIARLRGNIEALERQQKRREREITQKLRILKHFFPKQDKETVLMTGKQLSQVGLFQLHELLKKPDVRAQIGEPLPEVVEWFGNFFKNFASGNTDNEWLERGCSLVVNEVLALEEMRQGSGMNQQAVAEQIRMASQLEEARREFEAAEKALKNEQEAIDKISEELGELERSVRRKVMVRVAAAILGAGLAAGGVAAFWRLHWRPIPPAVQVTEPKEPPAAGSPPQTSPAPKATKPLPGASEKQKKAPAGQRTLKQDGKKTKPAGAKKKKKGKGKQKTGRLDAEPDAHAAA